MAAGAGDVVRLDQRLREPAMARCRRRQPITTVTPSKMMRGTAHSTQCSIKHLKAAWHSTSSYPRNSAFRTSAPLCTWPHPPLRPPGRSRSHRLAPALVTLERVRYFFTRRQPEARASCWWRAVRATCWKDSFRAFAKPRRDPSRRSGDLLCGPARGFCPETTAVYRVTDYRGREARRPFCRAGAQPLRHHGHGLLRRADHDQVEMGAGRAPPRQGFRPQRKRRLLLAGPRRTGRAHPRTLCCSARDWPGAGAVRTLARVFSVPVHAGVSATLCNDRPHAGRALRRGMTA